jgi:CRISPR-associated protein Cas1
MKKMLETLYILTPESYVYHRNENLCVSIGGQEKASVPVHQVDSIVFFGKNTLSTSLLWFCSKNDITITFLSEHGHFQGRLCGPVSGNVLLRKRQYQRLEDPEFSQQFVRALLYCKIRNSKGVLLRAARNSKAEDVRAQLTEGANMLSSMAEQLSQCGDIDAMRGLEGAAANAYFARFDQMLASPSGFQFQVRSRRPPQNEVNAVLSFLYTQLAHDISAALETVGLDPAAGFLHTLRPGRASLSLDLMEELRAPLCDRLTLTLFNKGQLSPKDFQAESQAVYLNDRGRKTVLTQWRARKREELQHPFLKEKIPIGLIPYTQAMLLARVLRGDLDRYPPFVWR